MLRGSVWKMSSQVGSTRLGEGTFFDGVGEAVRLALPGLVVVVDDVDGVGVGIEGSGSSLGIALPVGVDGLETMGVVELEPDLENDCVWTCGLLDLSDCKVACLTASEVVRGGCSVVVDDVNDVVEGDDDADDRPSVTTLVAVCGVFPGVAAFTLSPLLVNVGS